MAPEQKHVVANTTMLLPAPIKPTGAYMEVRYGFCGCHGQLCAWPKEFGGYKAVKRPAAAPDAEPGR